MRTHLAGTLPLVLVFSSLLFLGKARAVAQEDIPVFPDRHGKVRELSTERLDYGKDEGGAKGYRPESRFAFDREGWLVEAETFDDSGNSSERRTYRRNAQGRLEAISIFGKGGKDPDVEVIYAYGPPGGISSAKTLEKGIVAERKEFEYSGSGRLVATAVYGKDGALTGREAYIADDQGRIKRTTRYDGEGKKTGVDEFEYDNYGRKTSEASFDADGKALARRETTYRADGLPLFVEEFDPQGEVASVTKNVYDDRAWLTETVLTINGTDVATTKKVYVYSGQDKGNWVERTEYESVVVDEGDFLKPLSAERRSIVFFPKGTSKNPE
jgi:hypothetical protein